MRRMLREVPNCDLTHADRERDDHSRGWRAYVAEICDYIMVSPRPSRSQRQHGGREISFVSCRAAPMLASGGFPRPSTPSTRSPPRASVSSPRPDLRFPLPVSPSPANPPRYNATFPRYS